MATLAVWQYHQAPDRAWLIQAALFSAAAALTKFEGLPRVGVVVLALLAEMLVARLLRAPAPAQATGQGEGQGGRTWPIALTLAASASVGALLWTALELTRGIAANGEHIGPFQPPAASGVVVALVAVFGGVRTGGGLLVTA